MKKIFQTDANFRTLKKIYNRMYYTRKTNVD